MTLFRLLRQLRRLRAHRKPAHRCKARSQATGYPGFLLPPTATGQPGSAFGQSPRPELRPFGLLSPLSTSLLSPATPSPGQQGYRLDFSYPGESVAGSPLYTPGPAGHTSSPVYNKPFSQYRAAPAVSPYMNLFRDDTNFGRVDNYNTLVRPMVEQRNANLQVGGAIHGLQTEDPITRVGNQTTRRPRTRCSHAAFHELPGLLRRVAIKKLDTRLDPRGEGSRRRDCMLNW